MRSRSPPFPPSGGRGYRGDAEPFFAGHWEKPALTAGLHSGKLVVARVRFNTKSRAESYGVVPGLPFDVVLPSEQAANRALEGDVVALRLEPETNWIDDGGRAAGAARLVLGGGAVGGMSDAGEMEAAAAVLSSLAAQGSAANTADMDAAIEAMALLALGQHDGAAAGASAAGAAAPASGVGAGAVGAASADPSPPELWRAVDVSALGFRAATADATDATDATDDAAGTGSAPTDLPIGAAHRSVVASLVQRAAATGLRPTACVVGIVETRHNPQQVGSFRIPDNCPPGPLAAHQTYMLFAPLDKRYPFLKVLRSELPEEVLANPSNCRDKLYQGLLCEWSQGDRLPRGCVLQLFGEAGDIAAETMALLQQHGVDHGEFPPAALACLAEFCGDTAAAAGGERAATDGPEPDPWSIPASEIAARRDLRRHRVFSIDPSTAKDLDDALHVTDMRDGTVEVGVHIADVSHFVREGTALDKEAKRRGTTVYLVQMIVPMLPPLLCEQLCSLNPSVDRLAYSVIFRLRKDGALAEAPVWYGRTVIRSCCKLDYTTAQRMIEGEITEEACTAGAVAPEQWEPSRRPTDGHTLEQVRADVLLLHQVAAARRRQRFASGALTLQRVKLTYERAEDGHPTSVRAYMQKESNQLVEEYMLLGNYLVAQQLILVAKDRAFLRRHPPPDTAKLEATAQECLAAGVELDTSSSAALHASLQAVKQRNSELGDVAMYMLTNPMKPAVYFVAGKCEPEDWRHYALNIPYYTHFTSPIRRYADVMVHRLLTASLCGEEACAGFYMNVPDIGKVAGHCSDKKLAAKRAQERSDLVYLCVYLLHNPLVNVAAAVTGVGGPKYFSVLVQSLGVEAAVFVEELGCNGDWDADSSTLFVRPMGTSPLRETFTVRLFDRVAVDVTATTNPMKLKVSCHGKWRGDAATAAAAAAAAVQPAAGR